MQRRAVLCAGFGKRERAAGKIESCEAVAAGKLCAWGFPVQPTGNHQVQYEPEIAFNANRDTLADPPEFAYYAALNI